MTVKNFTEFFKTENDIYVQNISNCQVSVMFEIGAGHTESYLFTNTKDPVNLTQEIPFSAIKASMDMRKMLNRVPPALKVLTQEEYTAYYSRAAATRELPDATAAIQDAARRRVTTQHHIPLDSADKHEEPAAVDQKTASAPTTEDEINPKILNLCLQVHPRVEDTAKITAQTFLVELDSAGTLSLLDWEYVLAHGYYKTVKNLAKKNIAHLAAQDAEDVVEEKPAPKKAKKAAVRQPVGE